MEFRGMRVLRHDMNDRIGNRLIIANNMIQLEVLPDELGFNCAFCVNSHTFAVRVRLRCKLHEEKGWNEKSVKLDSYNMK